MILHAEELELAHAYDTNRGFEGLSDRQLYAIKERARELHRWFKAHLRLHNLASLLLIVAILGTDAYFLLGLPRLFLTNGRTQDLGWILIASFVVSLLHAWLMYSLAVLSLHEGAAHNLIFCGTGSAARIGQFMARNLCRVQDAEPEYYAACHMAHHAKFGTEHDSEFLNFIVPHRLWMALMPLGFFIDFGDFIIHRPTAYTRGRAISSVLGMLYHGVYAYLVYRSFGLLFTVLTMFVLAPHFGFYLDRLRQFTEHNLMPLENQNGARNLGIGFWGLLIGGGPWGQPCHLAHHLAPAIPWYQQIVLHFYIKGLLTQHQRAQFLITPFTGFPRLVWQVVRDANAFARKQRVLEAGARSA